jgi:predicted aconitase
MFHVVGVTPEAPTLDAATGGERVPAVDVTLESLREARDELGRAPNGPLGAVSIGTPHASLDELERLAGLLGADRVAVPLYVNVGRHALATAEERGLVSSLGSAGVRIVSDTCTYIAPVMEDFDGVVMTDSGKWAWYAPANIGAEVVIAGLEECVRSAVAGRVLLDERLWADG